MAQVFGIDRQPTQLDYASPTQFKFSIVQLPKVEFFTTACNLPSITLADAIFPTPFTDVPVQGDKLTFDNLIISFIVDESLENYIQLQKWLFGIGFPKSRQQFTEFRDPEESVTPVAKRGISNDIGDVKPSPQVKEVCLEMQPSQYFQIKTIHYWRLDLEMFIQHH